MSLTSYGYPRMERLRARRDFLRLSASGKKIHSANFIILVAESDLPVSRLGITVSRKVGNAVVRNRIKRSLREYYRLHKTMFPVADYSIIARQGAAKLDGVTICRELDRQPFPARPRSR